MRLRRRIVVALAFAVAAGACGATDTPESTATTSTTSVSTTPTSDPGESEPPPALPASWAGISEDTITIGVVWSDLDELREMGLVDINYGDIELVWQTVIDDINARGGIGGRTLEMIFDQYNPVLSSSVEEMCIRLTEDNTVFAVVGSLAGPALEGILCFIELQETMVLGGVHRPELLDRAKVPWITTEWSQERRYAALLRLYQQQGLFGGRMALLDDHREHTGLTNDIVLPALADIDEELASV